MGDDDRDHVACHGLDGVSESLVVDIAVAVVVGSIQD